MEKTRVFASLQNFGNNGFPYYRIRFSVAASRVLDGYKHCTIQRTESGSHIVITPLSIVSKDTRDYYHIFAIHIDQEGAAIINCGKIVTKEPVLRPAWFGKKYRIKKDAEGKIYICLREEVA